MRISRFFYSCMPLLAVLVSPAGKSLFQAKAQDFSSLSCGDLWFERNAIFARNGYCFKTDRGLRVFGNANCRYEAEADVPMSQTERRQIEIIRDVERRKGCQF